MPLLEFSFSIKNRDDHAVGAGESRTRPILWLLGILSIWMGQMDSLRAGLAAHRFVGVTRLSPLVAVPVGGWPPLGWSDPMGWVIAHCCLSPFRLAVDLDCESRGRLHAG